MSAYKIAERRAKMALERQGHDPELLAGLIDRYARAEADVEGLRAEWDKFKRNPLAEGGATGKALAPHPLVKQIQEAEKQAAQFGEDCGLSIKTKRAPGRPVTSDRELPPKLSVVKRG